MLYSEGDSMWGNIDTRVEIATNIYYVCAEHGEGVMVQKDVALKVLSPKAVTLGMEDNGCLWYGRDDNADIPIYEILQKRVALCRRIEAKTLEQIREIEEDGQLRLTGYFGECPPPKEIDTASPQKVRNGIYFVGQGQEGRFAVHRAVADNFMSPMACEFGTCQDEYLYYDLTTCAIPIYELSQIFEEVKAIILSTESLCATIYKNFSLYFSSYNAAVPEEEQIPAVSGPAGPFLKRQVG